MSEANGEGNKCGGFVKEYTLFNYLYSLSLSENHHTQGKRKEPTPFETGSQILHPNFLVGVLLLPKAETAVGQAVVMEHGDIEHHPALIRFPHACVERFNVLTVERSGDHAAANGFTLVHVHEGAISQSDVEVLMDGWEFFKFWHNLVLVLDNGKGVFPFASGVADDGEAILVATGNPILQAPAKFCGRNPLSIILFHQLPEL